MIDTKNKEFIQSINLKSPEYNQIMGKIPNLLLKVGSLIVAIVVAIIILIYYYIPFSQNQKIEFSSSQYVDTIVIDDYSDLINCLHVKNGDFVTKGQMLFFRADHTIYSKSDGVVYINIDYSQKGIECIIQTFPLKKEISSFIKGKNYDLDKLFIVLEEDSLLCSELFQVDSNHINSISDDSIFISFNIGDTIKSVNGFEYIIDTFFKGYVSISVEEKGLKELFFRHTSRRLVRQ